MIRLLLAIFAASSLFAKPPHLIPVEHLKEFNMGGKVVIAPFYRDDTYAEPREYTRDLIERYENGIARRESLYYGDTDQWLYQALDDFPEALKGKTVGIIGSVEPMYECVTLAWGGKPVTIEYNKLSTDDPRFTLLTVEEYEQNPIQFDAILFLLHYHYNQPNRYQETVLQTMQSQLCLHAVLFLQATMMACTAH